MEIVRDVETRLGQSSGFTGLVYSDPIITPGGGTRAVASSIHFAPGARTAWHSHPRGQTLWITEGVGLVQRRGSPIEIVRAGDRVFIDPGEDHWHGAAPLRFLSHVAITELEGEEYSASIGDHVSDEEYAAAPAVE